MTMMNHKMAQSDDESHDGSVWQCITGRLNVNKNHGMAQCNEESPDGSMWWRITGWLNDDESHDGSMWWRINRCKLFIPTPPRSAPGPPNSTLCVPPGGTFPTEYWNGLPTKEKHVHRSTFKYSSFAKEIIWHGSQWKLWKKNSIAYRVHLYNDEQLYLFFHFRFNELILDRANSVNFLWKRSISNKYNNCYWVFQTTIIDHISRSVKDGGEMCDLPDTWIPFCLRLMMFSPTSVGLNLISYKLSGRSLISHSSLAPLGEVPVASMSSGFMP